MSPNEWETLLLALGGYEMLLQIAAAVILAPYILGPVIVRLSHNQRANPEIDYLTEVELPAPAREFFEEVAGRLESVGFPAPVRVKVLGMMPTLTAMAAIFRKGAGLEFVGAFTIFQERRGHYHLMAKYVEIYFKLGSGQSVCINNTKQLQPFPRTPLKLLFQFPGIKDAARLYRIQTMLVVREPSLAGKRKTPMGEDAVTALADSIRSEVSDAVTSGYLCRRGESDVYRPTWKGAILMCLKLLWPASIVLRISRRRRTRALLRSIGFESETAA